MLMRSGSSAFDAGLQKWGRNSSLGCSHSAVFALADTNAHERGTGVLHGGAYVSKVKG